MRNLIIIFILWSFGSANQYNNSNTRCIKTDKYCQCDANCGVYNDCCAGHKDFENAPEITMANYKCQKLFNETIRINNNCKNNQSKYYDFCKNNRYHPEKPLLNILPVISQIQNHIYLNKFCALCNGIEHFEFLHIQLSCHVYSLNLTILNDLMKLNNKSCKLSGINSTFVRYCDDTIRSCPKNYIDDSKLSLKTKCLYEPYKKINSAYKSYRNWYCCKCHNKTCFSLMYTFPFSKINRIKSPSISVLQIFSWDDDGSQEKLNVSLNNAAVRNSTNTTFSNHFVIINYFSLTFQFISSISLLFLIILYTIKPIFHNFGGYLTICLGVNLLIYYILTIILMNMDLKSNYCRIFGVLRHFIFINNFIWMSIYALDLLQTFGLKSFKAKPKTFKLFSFYLFSGLSCGIMIMIGVILTESLLDYNSKWRPGFGGSNCWFTNMLGGMVWFFIPVCLLLIWNILISVIVFYKLYKTSTDCRIIKRHCDSQNTTIWLCIRLTSVFGVVYVMSVASALGQQSVLVHISGFLMDLQGLFLAICFCWNNKVKRIFRMAISSFTSSMTRMSSKSVEPNVQTKHKSDDRNDNQI